MDVELATALARCVVRQRVWQALNLWSKQGLQTRWHPPTLLSAPSCQLRFVIDPRLFAMNA